MKSSKNYSISIFGYKWNFGDISSQHIPGWYLQILGYRWNYGSIHLNQKLGKFILKQVIRFTGFIIYVGLLKAMTRSFFHFLPQRLRSWFSGKSCLEVA